MKKRKIGDVVISFLTRPSGEKLKVKGKIKSIKSAYGGDIYTITEGTIEDFSIRKIK